MAERVNIFEEEILPEFRFNFEVGKVYHLKLYDFIHPIRKVHSGGQQATIYFVWEAEAMKDYPELGLVKGIMYQQQFPARSFQIAKSQYFAMHPDVRKKIKLDEYYIAELKFKRESKKKITFISLNLSKKQVV